MGWLRLVGSLTLKASFAKYRLFYRALLQKRPIILRSLLIVATPYHDAYALLSVDRGIVACNFSPRNLTQVTSAMKPGQGGMVGFALVKRVSLREGLY